MRAVLSWTAGGLATLVLTLLLASLAPPSRPEPAPALRPATRATFVERAPIVSVPEAPGAPKPERRRKPDPERTAGAAPGARPGRPSPLWGGGGPAALARNPWRRGAADGPAIAWPTVTAWATEALTGVPVPIGGGDPFAAAGGTPGGSDAPGSGGGTGPGTGTGEGGGTGSRRPAGPSRRPIAEYAPQPPYPPSARAREETGFVEVLIHIDANGAVTSVEVTARSGGPAFEDSVRGTVARWRFHPALRDGERQPATVRRRFHFRMVD